MPLKKVRKLNQELSQLELFDYTKTTAFCQAERLLAPLELKTWLEKQDLSVMHKLWATSWYGVYTKDFNQPLGEEIRWVEKSDVYSFIVPDMPFSQSNLASIRDYQGLVFFKLACLNFDAKSKLISVKSDLDSEWDVFLPQIIRKDYCFEISEAEGKKIGSTYLSTVPVSFYEKESNGWHGSLCINTLDPLHEAGDELRTDYEMSHNWKSSLSIVATEKSCHQARTSESPE